MTTLQCIWPVHDLSVGIRALVAEAREGIELVAARAGARLTGEPSWALLPGRDVPGAGAYDLVLRMTAPAVRVLPGPWQHRAACVGHGELFFGGDRRVSDDDQLARVTAARRLCGKCPVRSQCAEAGAREEHGIWGGYTAQERREMSA